MMWSGAESNRRHEDFQSSALPTELPDHVRMDTLIKKTRQKSMIFFTVLFIILPAVSIGSGEDWTYYMKKADKQFAAERWDYARENYEHALDRRPGLTAAMNRLAEICVIENDRRRALEYYTRSIAVDPHQADVQNAAAELNEFFGYYDLALAGYHAAVDADSMHLRARINLVRYYAARHDYAKASEHFDACARLGKDEGDRLVAEGAEEEKKGDPARAIELYREAVKKSPAHLDAYFRLTDLYRKAGDADAAIATMERVKQIRPHHEKAYVYAGHLYFAQRFSPRRKYMLERTILNLEKALELNPGNRETCYLLSDVYRFMGNDVKAAQLLERAEKLPSAEKPESKSADGKKSTAD
jgi:tetratricopeptide (TPR) repeat protein